MASKKYGEISGCGSAFLYDTLKDLNKEDLYKKIWGNSLANFTLIIFALAVIDKIWELTVRYNKIS